MSMEAKLRRAGLIVASGLFLDLMSLLPLHPLAFVGFVALGVPVTICGMICFLLTLLTEPGARNSRKIETNT